MGMTLVTPVSDEVVSLETVRWHLRLDAEGSPASHPDDDYLETVTIPAARAMAEQMTGLAIGEQVWTLTLDEFPSGAIQVPKAPIQSVTEIAYIDTNGDEQTLDAEDFAVDGSQKPGWILPVYGTTWPATQAAANAVRITFECGYTSGSVPADIRNAILLLVGHLYINRQSVQDKQAYEVPQGVEAILSRHRITLGFA